jgi:hypothetical protein
MFVLHEVVLPLSAFRSSFIPVVGSASLQHLNLLEVPQTRLQNSVMMEVLGLPIVAKKITGNWSGLLS